MKFIRRDGKVYGVKFGSEEEFLLFDDVIIENLSHNINDDNIKADIVFFFAGEKKKVSVPRSTYQTKRNLLSLQDKGLGVTEENAKYMVDYLKGQEKDTKIKKVHHTLGYDKEKQSFKLYDSIPNLSVYEGKLDIEPKGHFDEWLDMYNKHIKGRKELEFIILVGLSSAIVGMIGKDISIENPIVHIYGDSSSGKTTAVQLSLSSWGNPSLRANGLMQNYNETINSIMHNLNNNNGLPMCFDEISMSATEDFSSFIYSVSNGKEKGRLSNEIGKGFVKLDQAEWNTVIMSTGEYNILERAKQNDGLKVRVYSVGGVKWTEDSTMADEIKSCVLDNYGYLGAMFAERALGIGNEKLIERYENVHKKISSMLNKENIFDEFTHRRSKYYAVLIVVFKILKFSMGIKMDITGIFSIIKNIELESIQERNVGEQAYNMFLEEISKNRRKFPIVPSKRKRGTIIKEDVWGYVLRNDIQAEIFPDEFKKICRKLGFQSHNVILNKWKQKGILDYESDRNYRQRNVGQVYVVNLNKEFIESIDGVDNNVEEEITINI